MRQELAVFDLACGNLRFERFLLGETNAGTWVPEQRFRFYTVDNNASLLPVEPATTHQNLDVMEVLLREGRLTGAFTAPACDLAVCFGFLHHVPLPEWRLEVLRGLLSQTTSGGVMVVSLWQFLKDGGLALRAEASHRQALCELSLPNLGEGDYLLGWQEAAGAYRYCHSFSDAEVKWLAASVEGRAELVADYQSDGRTGDLNRYLIWRVK